MVADYSSFLEFVGAVYFTMCLSKYLTNKIWNPEDTKKFERALDGLGMQDDEEFKKAVLAANTQKGEKLQAELSKKSLIGLFVVAFLLLFCGYEQSVNETDALSLLHLELAYSCAFFLLTLFLLQWVVFKKWKYVVFYIFSIVGFFSLIRWKNWVYNCCDIEKVLVNNIGIVVCATVSIPILWQIFITWIHKSVFYGYVKSKIREAQSVYKRVEENIKNGQYEMLPQQYYSIYIRNSQASDDTTRQQAIDDSLTEYKGALYNDIRVIGLKVRMYQLLFSWFVNKFKTLLEWVKNILKNKSIMRPKKLEVENYADYAKKFKAMKAHDKNLKMKKFCETENINFEEFSKYYCKYCYSH